MAWENEKKSESYTFRMKPQVWETILEYVGNGRNEKLENLVYFAHYEKEEIQAEIDNLEVRREMLKQEIEEYKKIVDKLKRIQWGVNELLMIADGVEKNHDF